MIIALDFDGTVADTMHALTMIATDVINRHHGLEESDACGRYLATIGASFPDQLEELFPGNAANADAAVEFLGRQEDLYQVVELFPDARAAIGELLEHEASLVIVSSTERRLTAPVLMRELPTGIYKELTVMGREYGRKEEQLYFLNARTMEPVVFVGDTVRDAQVALRANVRFLAVATTVGMDRWANIIGAQAVEDLGAAATELVAAMGSGPQPRAETGEGPR